ncbi:hypothetical protein [Microcoleus sp. D2_18a_D3]|uniref:hypothetical protein n=1 Tax=Microcoleus sp. D2_18a_D3 TaxID=3055330 RepID=UPI002FCFF3DD
MNYSKRARRLGLRCGIIFNQLFMGGVAETAHKKYFLIVEQARKPVADIAEILAEDCF